AAVWRSSRSITRLTVRTCISELLRGQNYWPQKPRRWWPLKPTASCLTKHGPWLFAATSTPLLKKTSTTSVDSDSPPGYQPIKISLSRSVSKSFPGGILFSPDSPNATTKSSATIRNNRPPPRRKIRIQHSSLAKHPDRQCHAVRKKYRRARNAQGQVQPGKVVDDCIGSPIREEQGCRNITTK